MAGLYVHIPFCRSRCIYCGFYSTTALELRQQYVDAVCREWQIRCHELREPLHTIYIGGGTPSQLTESQLQQLLDHFRSSHTLASHPLEVTIEVNPDDVTASYAKILPQLGINRVSMGVQTFDDCRLRFLHRRHTSAQVSQAIDHLRAADICNISVDLMYGFPGETLGDWECDIEHALSLDVEHISAYCLMVEEGTELHRMDVAPCDEETERQMYYTLIDRLDAAGYEHYEISNFAKQTRGGAMPSVYRSRHNSGYWNDIPFVGLGAAAHSYDKQSRSWNCANLRDYIAAIGRGHLPSEREVIDADTHYNDLVTTALRTSDGLDFDMLSEDYRLYCMKEAERFLSSGLLVLDGHRLKLTRSGLFVSDMVMASLLCVPVESGSEK